ncbi:MAG: hypothetical protein EXS49_00705 [Candidatus Pacebacteria bacterium]|nr:hypothetical protein [Candidatus Paceibacterota bacterium]
MKNNSKYIYTFVICLLILNGFIWSSIFSVKTGIKLYFLNVGQGDSELIEFSNGIFSNPVHILIDAGVANGEALKNLDKIISPFSKKIDIALMTHAQLDHFGGFMDIFQKYKVGYFIWNGKPNTTKSYESLVNIIDAQKINKIKLAEGDSISYGDYKLKILSPDVSSLASKELNDGCLVTKLESKELTALFTCDIGSNIEDILVKKYNLASDILKVPHHGSRFSSSANFLSAVSPKVSIIEVGKNTYGHPTPDTLKRLSNSASLIFTTKDNGTMLIEPVNNSLKVYKM